MTLLTPIASAKKKAQGIPLTYVANSRAGATISAYTSGTADFTGLVPPTSGVLDGDILIAVIGAIFCGDPTPVLPAGWNNIFNYRSGSEHGWRAMWKYKSGTEPYVQIRPTGFPGENVTVQGVVSAWRAPTPITSITATSIEAEFDDGSIGTKNLLASEITSPSTIFYAGSMAEGSSYGISFNGAEQTPGGTCGTSKYHRHAWKYHFNDAVDHFAAMGDEGSYQSFIAFIMNIN